MRAHVALHPLALLAVVVGMADVAAAQGQATLDPAVFALSPDSRVRCLDQQAEELLLASISASPTVAGMVIDLQSTDLIVGIETEPFQAKTKGDLRLLATTPATRLVRIRIRIPGDRVELISVLGHELRHALELAAAPGVRDRATLRAHYMVIGFERKAGGYYETEAALATGRRVAIEVGAVRASRLMASYLGREP